MDVFVLTTGSNDYEDNISIVGVFSTKQKAEEHINKTEPHLKYKYGNLKFGDYWYDIDSFTIDQ